MYANRVIQNIEANQVQVSGALSGSVRSLVSFFSGATMKKIPLTQGMVAMVDDADYEWLNQWKWCAAKMSKNCWYAVAWINKKQIGMHRLIMNNPHKKLVDHRDNDGLNNQRSNLRICSCGQNVRNSRKNTNSTSRFKGVSWCTRSGKWQVHIHTNGKSKNLGLYDDEIIAAKRYNEKALNLFGEFARINTFN